MEEIDLGLVVAGVSVVVAVLCLGLFVTALLRARKASKAGGTFGGETAGELRTFARNQFLSAIVMIAFAVIIFLYS